MRFCAALRSNFGILVLLEFFVPLEHVEPWCEAPTAANSGNLSAKQYLFVLSSQNTSAEILGSRTFRLPPFFTVIF